MDVSGFEVDDNRDGASFGVRVRAGAKRNAIVGVHAGRLKLQVQSAPEKGKANEAVRALLAEALGVAVGKIEILQGLTSPDKRVRVRDVNAAFVIGRCRAF